MWAQKSDLETSVYFGFNSAVPYTDNIYSTPSSSNEFMGASDGKFFSSVCLLFLPSFLSTLIFAQLPDHGHQWLSKVSSSLSVLKCIDC
jgi:hypothetical protein